MHSPTDTQFINLFHNFNSYFFFLFQQFLQIVLSTYLSHNSIDQLFNCKVYIVDSVSGDNRVHDFVVHIGIQFGRNVVFGNDNLLVQIQTLYFDIHYFYGFSVWVDKVLTRL